MNLFCYSIHNYSNAWRSTSTWKMWINRAAMNSLCDPLLPCCVSFVEGVCAFVEGFLQPLAVAYSKWPSPYIEQTSGRILLISDRICFSIDCMPIEIRNLELNCDGDKQNWSLLVSCGETELDVPQNTSLTVVAQNFFLNRNSAEKIRKILK
jgi:hypothetical protein